MAETGSLKALARLVFERDRKQDSFSSSTTFERVAAEALPGQPTGYPSGEADDAIPSAGLVAPSAWFERIAPPAEGEPGFDQPCAGRRGRNEEMDGVFLHFCAHCGAWGSHGYGVNLRAGHLGRWFCSTHRPKESCT